MSFSNNRALTRGNDRLSNVSAARGSDDALCELLFPNGIPADFIISGGVTEGDRYRSIPAVLARLVGRLPVIVLHGGSPFTEELANRAIGYMPPERRVPLWITNRKETNLEPFLGMEPNEVVMACRQMAELLNYTVTARFERIIRAYLDILRLIRVPVSLSGLSYLCGITDIGEFHDNIMELPCNRREQERIWAELGLEDDAGYEQHAQFRTLIANLSAEAERCGWNPDRQVGFANCIRAIDNHAVLTVNVFESGYGLMLRYLARELSTQSNRAFFLLIDNVRLQDEELLKLLCSPGKNFCVGIIAGDAVHLLGSEELFFRLAERMHCFVLYKHRVARTAQTLSELVGKYEKTKTDYSEGRGRGFGRLLPDNVHRDVRYSTENSFRIMPEEFTALGEGQAILFDTQMDRIIYFN